LLDTLFPGDVLMMKFGKAFLSSALLLSASLPCLASPHARRGPTSPKLFNKRSKATKPAAQRGIDDTRASQIQESLIKSGYLTGEASGHWDAGTEAAMQKFQSDNGWQTKLIPDSRAIIKLGLGPAQDSGQSASAAATSAAPAPSGLMPK
jgi:peptidoglycan hydrolase-like protein with peptidoglycan-binding domain